MKKINDRARKAYQLMSAAVTDSYVKQYLIKHFKILSENVTQEMIEKKRKDIIEFRKYRYELKLKRKQLAELKQDRIARGIVKICKVHGELTKDQTYHISNGTKNPKKSYLCIICNKKIVILRSFVQETKASPEQIPDEMVQLKQLILMLKKQLKEMNKCQRTVI